MKTTTFVGLQCLARVIKYLEGRIMIGHHPFSALLSAHSARDAVKKALVANGLAKMATGYSREWFYTQKNQLVCLAVETNPDDFLLSYYDQRGLAGVWYTPTGDGFHLPLARLTSGARAALVKYLARSLSLPEEAA
jgi:hypothetical protein